MYKEKITWIIIILFALLVSMLELITASMVVIFAQILTDPNLGKKYFAWFVESSSMSHPTLVLYSALFLGGTFALKNIIAAFEVFFQNFSIQNMGYRFKNDLLNK